MPGGAGQKTGGFAVHCRLVTASAGRQPSRQEYATLVREAASGDPAAVERLLERAQGLAHRFSLAVCGHANDVDDATQDALVKAFRHVSRIQQPDAFRSWLYRTVRNACLIGRRRRAAEPDRFESLEDLAVAGPGRNPEDAAVSDASSRRLRRALQRVPPSYRQVIFLRDMEGLSTKEAAVVLRTSEDNVKTRLRRARAQLRQHLEGSA